MIVFVFDSKSEIVSGCTVTSSASVGRSWKIGDSAAFCLSSFTCSITVANRAALSNCSRVKSKSVYITQLENKPVNSN